ncbi:hypothetical protein ACFX1Q_008708 [Malus domestica]
MFLWLRFFSVKKLSHHWTTSVLYVLGILSFELVQMRGRFLCSFGFSSLAELSLQDFLGLPGTFTVKGTCFSTVAGIILVQARDPAKLVGDIQNAMDEHGLNGTEYNLGQNDAQGALHLYKEMKEAKMPKA